MSKELRLGYTDPDLNTYNNLVVACALLDEAASRLELAHNHGMAEDVKDLQERVSSERRTVVVKNTEEVEP